MVGPVGFLFRFWDLQTVDVAVAVAVAGWAREREARGDNQQEPSASQLSAGAQIGNYTRAW